MAVVLYLMLGAVLPARGSRVTVRASHYWSTGYPMASGQMPFVGAVACSSDIGYGSTVITEDGARWQCLDTGLLDGWGFSRVDFYGIEAEAIYGEWVAVEVER